MRFLLLLLPNIYDIFTALAIGYAYFVDKETPLKIPFLFACIVIYMATRLGIFAGQIIGMLSGQVNDEQADVNDADAFAKKLIWGFVPQLIGVIIFQVIMAFCYLPNILGAPKGEQKQTQQQVQPYNKNYAATEETAQTVEEESQTVAESEPEAKAEDKDIAEQKIEPAIKEEPKYTAKVAPVARKPRNIGVIKTVSQQKPVQETIAQNPAPVVNTVRYEIPERTLSIAGIDKSEINTANVRPVTNVSVQTSSANSWSFSANTSANTAAQANTTVQNVSSTYGSASQPKRYPGDDNPINTSWGYYRTGKWAADAARTLNNK